MWRVWYHLTSTRITKTEKGQLVHIYKLQQLWKFPSVCQKVHNLISWQLRIWVHFEWESYTILCKDNNESYERSSIKYEGTVTALRSFTEEIDDVKLYGSFQSLVKAYTNLVQKTWNIYMCYSQNIFLQININEINPISFQ